MLKRILPAAALLAVCALPLAAQETQQQAKPAAQAGNDMTLNGQVIDVNCYVSMGASGQGHKACATACAKAGVALAILGSDGNIYMPVSSKPADPQNRRLEPFAEARVRITGVHRMSNGMHTIEIKTIEAVTT
jgi:type 1 fimbria pilin